MTLLEKEEFVLLSEVALGEEDQGRLVDILKKRNRFLRSLFGEDHDAFTDEAEECLAREIRILQRLEAERRGVLEEIDEVSKARQAAKPYAPIYPLSFVPPFVVTKA